MHVSPSETNPGEQEAVSCVCGFTRGVWSEEVPEHRSQVEYNGDKKKLLFTRNAGARKGRYACFNAVDVLRIAKGY